MTVKIKYPLELVEEDLAYYDDTHKPPPEMVRRLNRIFGSQGIIKIVAEVGKPVRITRYKREGEE